MAAVTIEVEDQHLLFRSYGELLGLNLEVTDASDMLERPVILKEDFISAYRITDDSYQVGICTAISASDGEEIMKIPFRGKGPLSLKMVVNTRVQLVEMNLATGLIAPEEHEKVAIYPNPVHDKLYVRGLSDPALARIYNVHGQLLLTMPVEGPSFVIDLVDLSMGVYLISFKTGSGTVIRRFLKTE